MEKGDGEGMERGDGEGEIQSMDNRSESLSNSTSIELRYMCPKSKIKQTNI